VIYNLKISRRAAQHLENLYLVGVKTWGEKQADVYYDTLIKHFELLCKSPLMFVSVDAIRVGYRRSVCGKHAIYYRVTANTVEIMGVLKKQNPIKQL
jgi:toxin ParE1/3/4